MLASLLDSLKLFIIESEFADACSDALAFLSEGITVIFLFLPQLLLVQLNDSSVQFLIWVYLDDVGICCEEKGAPSLELLSSFEYSFRVGL